MWGRSGWTRLPAAGRDSDADERGAWSLRGVATTKQSRVEYCKIASVASGDLAMTTFIL
ncbi:MAG: hypothetical protein HYW56_00575 [Candidatus Harrisonbacteria bacterium]|nr:hypothetical protein [Candidatus Harrisonbacteria bacterium]